MAAELATAKALCSGCDRRAACLDRGLREMREAGRSVWGGMILPDEWRAEQRRQRRAG